MCLTIWASFTSANSTILVDMTSCTVNILSIIFVTETTQYQIIVDFSIKDTLNVQTNRSGKNTHVDMIDSIESNYFTTPWCKNMCGVLLLIKIFTCCILIS